jgi:Flp pilus assembly protein TadB
VGEVETFNLGAVLFALLLLVWVGYAVPRSAERRELISRARDAMRSRDSRTARDLSEAAHSRPRAREVHVMNDDRLLLRPADPTARPRFDASPGTRVDPFEEAGRQRRTLRVVLLALALATIGVGVLAGVSILPVWSVLLPLAVLAAYVVGLRRAELDRRSRLRRAAELRDAGTTASATASSPARKSALAEEASQVATPTARSDERSTSATTARTQPDAAAQTEEHAELGEEIESASAALAAPGEWIPRPVPRPSYALRGEVEDLASRHAAHRSSVAPQQVALEVETDDVVDEALREEPQRTPASDLGLDEILARRRA